MNTPKPHAPITDLVALAYRGAKAVQTGFRAPTDDWQPILLFTTAEGRQHIIAAPHTDHQKQATADAITALLKRSHAVEALWLSSAWEVVPEATDISGRHRDVGIPGIESITAHRGGVEVFIGDDEGRGLETDNWNDQQYRDEELAHEVYLSGID